MLPNQFTPSLQLPMRDQEKQKSKPAINIPPGIDNLSFDKMPTLGANLDLSRSFEFCAMNIKGAFQNSFYNQWEADVDDLEERKILEDLKGGSRVGCYGDTKEEGSLFQRDRFNAAYSTNDKNFSEQNEFFPAESKDTAPKTQDNADFRRMPRAVAVQEVETHGIFNAGRKREASQKRSLRVITNPPHDSSPALGHVEKMMIPVRQHSLAETVNSEFIQGPIPDKDSGTKSSRSDFGKDERQGTAENEHKTKGNEQKESEPGQHQTMNRHAARNDPIIEGRQQDSREGRRESEERIVELIGNDGGDLELRVLQRRQEEFLKKTNNLQFNVMIVGATGLGKSTFIDALLNKNYAIQPSIKMSTREIIERQGVKTHKDINFKITLIDTPGYKNGEDLNVWFKTIEKYITSQFKRYKTAKDKLKVTKRDENTIEDKRVHALLYFVSGPRISQVDLDNMMKLQEYCNIIPILAKGDNYTAPEIKEIKKTFLEQALKKIKFFDFDEVLKDNPRKLSELKEGKFGPCPPFLIISSAKRIEISPGRFVYGRQYPWGTCNIENPEHSDFVLLQTLLGGHICLEAIEMTGYYYKDFIKKLKKDKQKKQEEKDANAKIGVGVAAVIGLAAFLGWKKSLF